MCRCIWEQQFNYNIYIDHTSHRQMSLSKIHTFLTNPSLSTKQRQQLIALLRQSGTDMPDLMFQNAYLAYKQNPGSDQRFIQLQEMIYNGLAINMGITLVRNYINVFKKALGENNYIRRLTRYVHYVAGGFVDNSPFIDLISQDLSDNQSTKKYITKSKREGKLDEYIQKMNTYLAIEPLDEEAWVQLGEIYAERGHYMRAAHCYEELVLLNPVNDVYTLKLSELYLTLENKESKQKAIKYLSYLITKRPDNLRALWILQRALAGDKENEELRQLCSDSINKLYSKKNPSIKTDVAF